MTIEWNPMTEQGDVLAPRPPLTLMDRAGIEQCARDFEAQDVAAILEILEMHTRDARERLLGVVRARLT